MMANTLLEETRQHHEDMERLERLIVEDLKHDAKAHKDKLLQGHRVRHMLDALQDRAQKLVRGPGPVSHSGVGCPGRAAAAGTS